MKITIKVGEGDDAYKYDLVSFRTPVESVDDWSGVLKIVAGLSDWVSPILLLNAALDIDFSEMHIGSWAKESKAEIAEFRDKLTQLLEKLE